MAHRDLIVVGASAGGLTPLRTLVSLLPADLAATVLIVLHTAPTPFSALPQILSRSAGRPVFPGRPNEPMVNGRILVSPPDWHLLVHGRHTTITRGPRVNNHRPAVDPLFFSAARWAGPRTIGVILSGTLDDGSAGLREIVRVGGKAIVQDAKEADYSAMPNNARRAAPEAESLGIEAIAKRIVDLVQEEVEDVSPSLDDPEALRETEQTMSSSEHPPTEGRPSAFSCPSCHGVLWELDDGHLVRYRCRVGHAFASAALGSKQNEALEEALWTAYRALRESASLSSRLAERAGARGLPTVRVSYLRKAADALARAQTIEKVLELGMLEEPAESAE